MLTGNGLSATDTNTGADGEDAVDEKATAHGDPGDNEVFYKNESNYNRDIFTPIKNSPTDNNTSSEVNVNMESGDEDQITFNPGSDGSSFYFSPTTDSNLNVNVNILSGKVIIADPNEYYDSVNQSGKNYHSIMMIGADNNDSLVFNVKDQAVFQIEGNIRSTDNLNLDNVMNSVETFAKFNVEEGGKLVLKPNPSAAKQNQRYWDYSGVRIDGHHVVIDLDSQYELQVAGHIGGIKFVENLDITGGTVNFLGAVRANINLENEATLNFSNAVENSSYEGKIIPKVDNHGEVNILKGGNFNIELGYKSLRLRNISTSISGFSGGSSNVSFYRPVYSYDIRLNGVNQHIRFLDIISSVNPIDIAETVSDVYFQKNAVLTDTILNADQYATAGEIGINIHFLENAIATGSEIGSSTRWFKNVYLADNSVMKNSEIYTSNLYSSGNVHISSVDSNSVFSMKFSKWENNADLIFSSRMELEGLTSANVDFAKDRDVTLNITKMIESEKIVSFTGGNLITVDASNRVTIVPPAYFTEGEIIVAGKSDSNTSSVTYTDDFVLNTKMAKSRLADYSLKFENGNMVIRATKKADDDIAANLGLTKSQVDVFRQAIKAAVARGDDDIIADLNSLVIEGSNSNQDAPKELVEQLVPSDDFVSRIAGNISISAFEKALGFVSNRLASRATQERGIATGYGMPSSASIWTKGAYTYSSQGILGSAEGTTTSGYHAHLGMEYAVSKSLRFGISAGRITSSASAASRPSNTASSMESYQFSLYSTIDFTRSLYLLGVVGFSTSTVDSSRNINFAGKTYTATSKYDFDNYFGRIGVGGVFSLKNMGVLTTLVSVDAIRFNPFSYKEEGAESFNMEVNSAGSMLARASVLSSLNFETSQFGGRVIGRLSLGGSYDITEPNPSVNVKFAGLSESVPYIPGEASVTRFSFLSGISTILKTSSYDLSASYELGYRDPMINHSISLTLKYKF